jgi:hypothetical protein
MCGAWFGRFLVDILWLDDYAEGRLRLITMVPRIHRIVAKYVSLALVLGFSFRPMTACAQDPLVTLPNNYRSILDNADVAVIGAHYGAHEKIPVHDHTAFATVFVYLNDSGTVRIDHVEDGKVESVVRPATVKGAYRVAPGIAERHSIENLGDTSSDFLRVELKRVSLDLKEPFRGKAPSDLSASKDGVEFTGSGLQIERIICVGSAPCEAKPASGPSLLIAFTSAGLQAGSTVKEKLEAGAVRWVPAGQPVAITPDAGSSGHVLRILFPIVQK